MRVATQAAGLSSPCVRRQHHVDVAGATDPAAITDLAEHLSSGGNDTGAATKAALMSGTGSTGTISWTNGRGAGIYQIAIGAIFKEAAVAVALTGKAANANAGTGSLSRTAAFSGDGDGATTGRASLDLGASLTGSGNAASTGAGSFLSL